MILGPGESDPYLGVTNYGAELVDSSDLPPPPVAAGWLDWLSFDLPNLPSFDLPDFDLPDFPDVTLAPQVTVQPPSSTDLVTMAAIAAVGLWAADRVIFGGALVRRLVGS